MEKGITHNDVITSFGSCFATEMGRKLEESDYNILNNPFGVLFNPASIASSIRRLESGREFTIDEVIDRDPLYGTRTGITMPKSYASFYHHGSFAAPSPEEFLVKANSALREASRHLAASDIVIITFGTSWVFRHLEKNIIVSNCHKRPAGEFRRERLSVEEIYDLFAPILAATSAPSGDIAPKRWIFTVSPIRHLADTLHGNQLSKATLLLAVDRLCSNFPNASYFPSYEIVLDELRDYRYYAEDTVHPSTEAVDYVWKRFKETCLS